MIIVQLSGGFGNQLFQYAAGLSLADLHRVQLKIDASLLRKKDAITGTIRNLDLDNLAKKPIHATELEIKLVQDLPFPKNIIEKVNPFHKRKVYKENSSNFDRNFFNAGDNLLLKGNRQSEKYFRQVETLIRTEFSLRNDIVEPVKAFAKTLTSQSSVSIHIRRGDYLTAIALEWLGILPISYYKQAIHCISEKKKNLKFYIFSDDIEWAKQNLKLETEHEFVSGEITKNAFEDFYLMSQCRHNIIANSTFSWWAAWLNSNPDKIVIAPKKWYNKPGLDSTDLIPSTWIRV